MLAVDEMVTREFLDYWGMERIPFPKAMLDPLRFQYQGVKCL